MVSLSEFRISNEKLGDFYIEVKFHGSLEVIKCNKHINDGHRYSIMIAMAIVVSRTSAAIPAKCAAREGP